jgi:hypothetical protein
MSATQFAFCTTTLLFVVTIIVSIISVNLEYDPGEEVVTMRVIS